MSSPFPERGEFVPVRPPGPQDVPLGAWPAHQAWYTPMPPVDVEAVAVPTALRVSAWLWLSASLLYVAGWVVAVFVDVPFVAADLASGPDFESLGEARAVAILMFLVGIAVAAVVGAVQTVFGFLLWRRRRWSRVLLTVLAVLMLLVLPVDVLVGLAWRYDAPSGVGDPWVGFAVVASLAALQFAVTIAAVVTMYVRGSNLFMAGRHG